MWTKHEIETVLDLWNTKSVEEIATELGRTNPQIVYIAKSMRNEGIELPLKKRKGVTSHLIKEIIRERKIRVGK